MHRQLGFLISLEIVLYLEIWGFSFNVLTVKYEFGIKYIIKQNKSRPNRNQNFSFHLVENPELESRDLVVFYKLRMI